MSAPGKKPFVLLFALLLFIFLSLGIGVQRSVLALDDIDEELKQLEVVIDIMGMIQKDYVNPEKTKTQDLINGAIHGMVSKLDRYSVYMEKDEAKEFNDQTQGSFGGLGIQFDIVDGWLTVIAPLPGTPADKAEVMSGDRIVEIEGESTRSINIDQVTKKLKGEPGTTVHIVIARKGETKLLEKTITRAIINTNAVEKDEKRMLGGSIGYIRLRDFTRDAAEEVESAVRELQQQGMKGLIFDLRYNGGGLLNVAIKICDLFIEPGKVIMSHKDNRGVETKYYAEKKPMGDFLMAVLVNEYSASASEIVAGCIQDQKRGVIVGPVGHKTLGKGSVQTLYDLKQGASLKLTTAKYYTPAGHSIEDDHGLTPDVFAQITDDQRDAIRKAEKIGYLLPELVGQKSKEEAPHKISVEEVFQPPKAPNGEDSIYDIELYAAYQCLKGAEVLLSLNGAQN